MMVAQGKGTIFVDFDGTLVDTAARQFAVYRDIAARLKVRGKLKKDGYWRQRRSGLSFVKVFQKNHAQADRVVIEKAYKQNIEKKRFLEYDRLMPEAKPALRILLNDYNLVLVSLRAKKNNLVWQMKRFGLDDFFAECLIGPDEGNAVRTKQNLIRQSRFFKARPRFLIGDTEVDVLAGHKAGCGVVAVSSGIRDADYLSGYNPEHLVDTIAEAIPIVKKYG